jgi:hypothetical protein
VDVTVPGQVEAVHISGDIITSDGRTVSRR